MSHFIIFLLFRHFSPIFVLLKVTCLVTLFDCKFQLSKFWAFLIDFCVNDILGDFQTLCVHEELSCFIEGL